jgi:hypothetical protein
MTRERFVASLLVAAFLVPLDLRAEDPPAAGDVSFFRQVLPILRQKNCTGCHQPAKQGGEYVMTDFAALRPISPRC